METTDLGRPPPIVSVSYETHRRKASAAASKGRKKKKKTFGIMDMDGTCLHASNLSLIAVRRVRRGVALTIEIIPSRCVQT